LNLQLFLISVTLVFGVVSGITSRAAGDCPQPEINITSVFVPANFIPLVPEDCGQEGGKLKALPLSTLPVIIIRLFGFAASLITYLFGLIVIFSGLQWAWGGIDGQSTATAKKNLKNGLIAMLVTFSSYTIINTILIVLNIDPNGAAGLGSDLTDFVT